MTTVGVDSGMLAIVTSAAQATTQSVGNRAASVLPRQGAPAPVIRRRGAPTLLAAAGGLALWLAFPSHDLSLLAVLAPAALSLAVHGRGLRAGGWLGFVVGLAYLVPLLSWTGVYVGAWPWLLLAVWQASYLALLGAGLAAVQRLPLWPVWAAALWVADEALRGRWFVGGFPWARLGFSQADSPFTAYVAYGGVPLLGFAVALTGALLAGAVVAAVRRFRSRSQVSAGLIAAALAVPVAGALLPISAATDANARSAVVAVIQGDVPQPGLDFNARRRAVLDNHVIQTLALAERVDAGTDPQPSLVLWPENASDIDPYRNPDAAEQIDRAARAIGVPILVGAVRVNDDDTLGNVGIVWDPGTGPGQTYLKRHPVPFGEYIPWRSVLEQIAPIVNEVPRDFVGGDRPGVLAAGGINVGDVICFEVAYDGLVGDVVDAGAEVIVVQTNNATFGYTDETYQQLAMGRLRAVEHGRTVLVAATSGVSAIIAPDGSVEQQSGLFTPATFVQAVELREDRTLASRLGSAPEWVLSAAGLTALAVGVWRGRSGRRSRRDR